MLPAADREQSALPRCTHLLHRRLAERLVHNSPLVFRCLPRRAVARQVGRHRLAGVLLQQGQQGAPGRLHVRPLQLGHQALLGRVGRAEEQAGTVREHRPRGPHTAQHSPRPHTPCAAPARPPRRRAAGGCPPPGRAPRAPRCSGRAGPPGRAACRPTWPWRPALHGEWGGVANSGEGAGGGGAVEAQAGTLGRPGLAEAVQMLWRSCTAQRAPASSASSRAPTAADARSRRRASSARLPAAAGPAPAAT